MYRARNHGSEERDGTELEVTCSDAIDCNKYCRVASAESSGRAVLLKPLQFQVSLLVVATRTVIVDTSTLLDGGHRADRMTEGSRRMKALPYSCIADGLV